MSANKQVATTDNQEHIGPDTTGDNIHAKKVANYAWDGSNWQRVLTAQAKKITIDGSSTYIAVATPGTQLSDALWQVQKIDDSVAGTTLITWADGNANFDNIATDLTTLTYS